MKTYFPQFHKVVLLALIFSIAVTDINFSQDQKPEAKKPKIKSYSEVITKDAKTSSGVFTVHNVDGKWFYEIPEIEIGRLFLWVSQIKKNQAKLGYGGVAYNNQIVRWDKRNDQILLRQIQHTIVADEEKAVYNAVDASTFPPILMTFDIQAYGQDSSAVIEVTEFLTAEKTEFVPKKMFNAKRLDPKRTFIDKITAYPENIEADVVLTFDVDVVPTNNTLGTVSIMMHYSMVHLPKEPMMPRLADSRVGFFSITQEDYGYESHRTEMRTYITKWRLEKKDPSAAISEPVKPITFYIDRSVPEKWKPYFKQGVEDWLVAFEQAGFKNAIIAKYAPSVEEDPSWNTEDATVSSISWLPSTIENAFGPHIHDPRTGEILEADIKIYHNVMNLLTTWYFSQVAPLDPRAQRIPLPDGLMGELLRYVVAHEVGHSLGFPHNGRASSVFPVDSLRSKSFTEKYGNEASIMDYGRFNYVAQPGDNARLIPIISIYDKFATEWGYTPFPEAKTPDEERPFLEKIVRRQDTNPFLHFSNFSQYDPSAQTEDLGDDGIKATELGLKNIYRIMDFIISAGTTKEGDDYSMLSHLYDRVLQQRTRKIGHVAMIIGGVNRVTKHIGQPGAVFKLVPYERQKKAMSLLLEEGFKVNPLLVKRELLDLIQPFGNVDKLTTDQITLVKSLLNDARIQRMSDAESKAYKGEKIYTVSEFLSDLTNGLFAELNTKSITVDPYRRKLQRAFVEELGNKINPEKPVQQTPITTGRPVQIAVQQPARFTDLPPVARGKLSELKNKLTASVLKSKDDITKYHIQDLASLIDEILKKNKVN
jgi:hypothetical protein